jgi:hypothetical protein
MMELSLTRAPLRRGSDAEANDGFPTDIVEKLPRLTAAHNIRISSRH